MSLLNGSLQIGRSAILTQQAAMQVIGNNIANAGNTDYTRQTPILTSVQGPKTSDAGGSGAGVRMTGIDRQIDQAITERLRQSISDQSHDSLISTTLGRLETLYNEMSNTDLSTAMTDFFNAFSKLQSDPQDLSSRSVVTQTADALTGQIRTLRSDVVDLYNEMGDTMTETVNEINRLTGQIANLNVQVANTQSGGNSAGSLLDQRDGLLKQLSGLTNITTVDQPNGEVTVYIDSDPLIQGNQARKLEVSEKTEGDIVTPQVIFSDNKRVANVTGGKAGAIDELVNSLIGGNLKDLDSLAAGLIYEVNNIHSSGQGLIGYSDLTSSNRVEDPAAALNAAGLPFTPGNGSFKLTVTDKNTDPPTKNEKTIYINSSVPGQQTLNDLAAQINAVDNVSATVTPDGKLNIASDADNYSFTFSEDSSGTLASLGINGFFTGSNASDIAVNSEIADNLQLLACAKSNLPGDGTNAADISKLRDNAVSTFNGLSITGFYEAMVGKLGTQTASAKQGLEVHTAINEALQNQRDAVSGVSIDEETINLMSSQTAFQGAARFITTVNSLLQEVMKLL